jgi:hypothetical protein
MRESRNTCHLPAGAGRVISLCLAAAVCLPTFAEELLSKRPPHFPVSDFKVDEFCLSLLAERQDKLRLRGRCKLFAIAADLVEGTCNSLSAATRILEVFYLTGLIGLKYDTSAQPHWTYQESDPASPIPLTMDTRVYIHPAFHRALRTLPQPGYA